MPELLNIETDNNLLPSEDYYFLRSEGIKLIEKLSGKIWTDYNTHDPGITLLEALCYTLTDLGYRTSFDIKDILAPDPVAADNETEQLFYSAKQILPNNPVTLTDYRKLIIDTEGVKNAWIEVTDDYEVLVYLASQYDEQKQSENYNLTYDSTTDTLNLRGLYQVTVEFEDEINTKEKEKEVTTRIRRKLNNHRNLCEDFLSIQPIEIEKFKIEAELQVKEVSDIEKINAQVFETINNFFSPSVHFYSLGQLVEKGVSAEEIFDGPVLKHGFIDTGELEKSEKYMDVHLSDIIHLMSDVDGVIAVKKCIFPIETQLAFSDLTSWIKDVKARKKVPRLDIENSTITFVRNSDRHRPKEERIPDKERVKAIYLFLQSNKKSTKLKGVTNDIVLPEGEYMDLADYYPFQHGLPACYGMEESIIKDNIDDGSIETAINELNEKDTHTRRVSERSRLLELLAAELLGKPLTSLETDHEKHKVKSHFKKHQLGNLRDDQKQILQLRGFLMVFEQILSDYLSQLNGVKQLFSFNSKVNQTYFTQVLKEINDIEMLFIHKPDDQEYLLHLTENETRFIKRRNAILNHLLARFGEDMDKYGAEIKVAQKEKNKININNKAAFLSEYVTLSSYRGNGFVYRDTDNIWNTDNVIGLKKRICRLLGVTDYRTRFSTANNIEFEKVLYANNVEKYIVVIRHSESKNVLLKSIEYDSIDELSDPLTYILQNGSDRKKYLKDAKHNKHTYGLRSPSQENNDETIATHIFDNNDELEYNFDALIETLQSFSQNENFHIVEHILLRPKIGPQGKIKIKKDSPISSNAVDLLHVHYTEQSRPIIRKTHQNTAFEFKSAKVDEQGFKLRLLKDNTEVMYVSEYLKTEKHRDNRITHIRQAGAERANYIIEKGGDYLYIFKLTDNSKVLAISKIEYQDEKEADVDIDELVKFFSYGEEQISEQQAGKDVDFIEQADPYSFQISVIIPNWPARFRDAGFKHLMEKAIYMETPAHVYAGVYWVDYKQMSDFESTYKPWLEAVAVDEIPDIEIVNNFIYTLNKLSKAD